MRWSGRSPTWRPSGTRARPPTAAADVYSVGCLLWHVLTGTPPYAGTDVEIAMAHLQAPVPQLPPGDDAFAPRLNGVLARAMAKSPATATRPPTAMRADLLAARARATDALVLPDVTAVRHAIVAASPRGSRPRHRRSGDGGAMSVCWRPSRRS